MEPTRTAQLDRLFRRWETRCSLPDLARFHRDGIVDEPTYDQQSTRLLFVMLEGSAEDKGNRHLLGADLREIYGRGEPRKTLTHNLGRWTRVLLDHVVDPMPLPGNELANQLRRISVMNLKKISGGATAAGSPVEEHAWRDRALLQEQVRIIEPDVIIACGNRANRIFGQIAHNDASKRVPFEQAWQCQRFTTLPALHPSHRGPTLDGIDRIARLAGEAGLASWGSQ